MLRWHWGSRVSDVVIRTLTPYITRAEEIWVSWYLVATKHNKPLGVHNLRSVPLPWRHNERDGVSNHQPHDCLLNHLFRRRSKKTSKLRVTGLYEGNSPVTGEFPAQSASNVEYVSVWWRHHAVEGFKSKCSLHVSFGYRITPCNKHHRIISSMTDATHCASYLCQRRRDSSDGCMYMTFTKTVTIIRFWCSITFMRKFWAKRLNMRDTTQTELNYNQFKVFYAHAVRYIKLVTFLLCREMMKKK